MLGLAEMGPIGFFFLIYGAYVLLGDIAIVSSLKVYVAYHRPEPQGFMSRITGLRGYTERDANMATTAVPGGPSDPVLPARARWLRRQWDEERGRRHEWFRFRRRRR